MQGRFHKHVRQWGALVLLLGGSAGLPAHAAEPLLLVHDPGRRYQAEFADSFEQQLHVALPGTRVERVETTAPALASRLSGGTGLLVTVGTDAARRIRALSPNRPVIHALMPRRIYTALPSGPGPRTAVFLEQPIGRFLALIRAALPHHRRVVSLHGPDSREHIAPLRALAAAAGLEFEPRSIAGADAVPEALARGLGRGDVLLTLPDRAVVNSSTARTLIIGAYRRDVPLVGYSRAYVKAGALMAVHSPPEAIARYVVELVAGYAESRRLPPPGPPKYFRVAVNYQLARTLGLSIPSEALLRRQVEGEAEEDES